MTTPLHYMIFSALYAPHMGGIESYTAGLADELTQQGNRVTIVSSNLSAKSPVREVLPSGLSIYRLPCHTLLQGRLPLPRRTKAYRLLWEELTALKPDRALINTHFYLHSLEAARFTHTLNIPTLILEHGSAHLSMNNVVLDRCLQAYEHYMTKKMQAFAFPFCGVSSAATTWLQHFGISAQGIIPNALNMKKFIENKSGRDFRSELNLTESTFIVASIGRLVPEKGIPALLEAARVLSAANDIDMAFIFAGDGPLFAKVQHAGTHIFSVGRLNANDVAALLCTSNVLCLPSRSEGFATILLEAAAGKTMPIVTAVGGVEELGIAKGRGMILDNASPECITDALHYAYANQQECKDCALRLHDAALIHNTWSNSVQALEILFERTVAQNPEQARLSTTPPLLQ